MSSSGSDEVDFEFEYEDSDDDMEDMEFEVENEYYQAKELTEEDAEAALEKFQHVRSMEETPGRWGFKSCKQIMKIYFDQLKSGTSGKDSSERGNKIVEVYKELLEYVANDSVTKNDGEKVIDHILNYVEGSELSGSLCELTLKLLEGSYRNDRLYFNTLLKLSRLYMRSEKYAALQKTLKLLRAGCMDESGEEDPRKGTQLLEVYALEIQMNTALKNNKKLKELYEKSLRIKSAIPHPKVLGVIRECGGKMHMMEEDWGAASSAFFEAFKCFDEAGMHQRRIVCLQYVVLAAMLSQSDINPLDSPEAKPYSRSSEIVAMTELLAAYQRHDIAAFESALQRTNANSDTTGGDNDGESDGFLRTYVQSLLSNVRSSLLLRLVAPYSRVSISYLGQQLGVASEDVEQLLLTLILDDRLKAAKVDQRNGVLVRTGTALPSSSSPSAADTEADDAMRVRYTLLKRWSDQLLAAQRIVSSTVTSAV